MFVIKYPFLMSFAGNPMRYLISTNEGGGGIEDSKSVIEIEFSDIDSHLIISWTSSFLARPEGLL
jgi:hypothetical protein